MCLCPRQRRKELEGWVCGRTEWTGVGQAAPSCLRAVGLLFPSPDSGLPAGSGAAFLTVIHWGSGFNGFSTFLKGKTLAYCIPVVQSLQAMKTKIQVSVQCVSPLLFTVRKKPSGGSTAVILGPKDCLHFALFPYL